jgi:hypothetical protein
MRTLTSVFSILALTFALGCSGGDDDDDGGGTADAAATGGAADAAVSTGPDAMAATGASSNLGDVCDQATPCATGTCTLLEEGATSGFCSPTCTMAGMADICGPNDGYTGPGVPYCGLGMAPDMRCAIGCGTQNAGDTSCPTGLTCKALIDPKGEGDLCAP